VARAAFRKGIPWLRLREDRGLFHTGECFASIFPTQGNQRKLPGVWPSCSSFWRLALVLVLQRAENLTDHQAADAVRGRIDVTYPLGLELADGGFDHTVLFPAAA